jgi:glycerol-3-phosphate acyltransferase PlsY
VLGAKTGAVVFIADLLKGFLPVYFLPRYTETLRPGMWALFFGAAAIVGHVKPIFLLWKGGGKGVATASGVFLALAPIPMLVAEVVWIVTFYFSRYVSLASLLGAAGCQSPFLRGIEARSRPCSRERDHRRIRVLTHRANIGRLRRGQEHRFVKRKWQADAVHGGRGRSLGHRTRRSLSPATGTK